MKSFKTERTLMLCLCLLLTQTVCYGCSPSNWKDIPEPVMTHTFCKTNCLPKCNNYFIHNFGQFNCAVKRQDPDPAIEMVQCQCCDSS